MPLPDMSAKMTNTTASSSDNSAHNSAIADKIWTWLDRVVIGENLCPFAKAPRARDQVRLVLINDSGVKDILINIAKECDYLHANPSTETTLIGLSKGLADFYDYLDTLELAQQLLCDIGYEGVFQLASFHPAYLFEGEAADATSHYTNRAPVPLFHLIREESITKALAFVEDPNDIVVRNIEHANKLGVAFFKAFL